MNRLLSFLKRYQEIIAAFVLVLALTACVELWMGRSWLGPDGRFGWWEGDIWSAENSQRFADPYSFTHIVHGILFYGLLWLATRRLPMRYRFLAAVIAEAIWEIQENSPFIIQRYREVTISLGYVGDSVINSLSDIGMMSLGFWIAYAMKPRISIAAVILMEVGCALGIRDNLLLNVLMLLYPVDSIRQWQMAIAPGVH